MIDVFIFIIIGANNRYVFNLENHAQHLTRPIRVEDTVRSLSIMQKYRRRLR